ncbi:MAG: heme biosynthesis HemY N-terminal domain-containing protein [Pseudomonas sp.]
MKPLRSLLILLVAVALGVLGAQWLSRQTRYDLGEVIVRVGGNDYVAPGPQAIVLLVIALLVLWLLWLLLSLPFRTWNRYRLRKGRARLIEGLRAADHGQWSKAEKLLATASEDDEVGAIALAGAVRVADARGDEAAAETFAHRLGERDPQAHALLQAERLLARARPADAVDVLDRAAAQPLPPRGLLLRTEALARIGRADEAYGQLGALRQQAALPLAGISALEIELAAASLEQAGDANALAARWETLSRTLRLEPRVVATYARRAAGLHWDDAAIHSLEQALDTRWDEALIRQYGMLPLEKYDSRRASAQRWLAQHPDSPGLLLTLGRLARHQRQAGQSEEFLQRAIAQGAGAEGWEELGHGFAGAGQERNAQQCYANALRVQRGEPLVELALRGSEPQTSTPTAQEERDEFGHPRLPRE